MEDRVLIKIIYLSNDCLRTINSDKYFNLHWSLAFLSAQVCYIISWTKWFDENVIQQFHELTYRVNSMNILLRKFIDNCTFIYYNAIPL